jgi:hypothetical protein
VGRHVDRDQPLAEGKPVEALDRRRAAAEAGPVSKAGAVSTPLDPADGYDGIK